MRTAIRASLCFVVGAALSLSSRAADGSWAGDYPGNWSTATNWVSSAIATGVNATARFTNNITAARTVNVDYATPLQLGNILFGPGPNAVTISGGAINLAASNAIPTITVTGNSAIVATRLQGTQGVSKAGVGILFLTATNNYSGPTTVSAGTLFVGNYGPSGELGNGIVTNLSNLTIARNNDVTITNQIVGTGALNVSGVGATSPNTITTIAGTNNFGGNVNVFSGSVRIVHSFAFGSSNKTVVMSNGTAGNPILLLDAIGGPIDLPGTVTFQLSNSKGSITNLAGDNLIRGPVRITSGGGGAGIKIVAGTLTLTNTITFIDGNRNLFVGGVSTGWILGPILSGTNTFLEKQDSGKWVIGNNNTYPGATQIRDGTLEVGTGGTLGNLSTNGVVMTNTAVLVFNRSDSYTTPNAISGVGAIRKVGAGTQTLTAISPVLGTTAVEVGRIDVNGRLTNSVITVSSGATLGGSGGVGTVSVLGSLEPGVVVGTLTATNVTLLTNSTLRVEAANLAQAAGTGFDQLSVAGDLTVNATAGNPSILDFKTLNGTVPGYAANFDAFAGLTVRVANVTGLLTGYAADQLVLVTTNFLNAYVGAWTTVVSGSSLDLVYTPALTLGANALIWDGTNGTAALEEGSGTWSTGGANWWDGAAETTWNQATATFGAGGSGSYTVNVAAAGVQAAGLAFVAGGSYEIAGPGGIAFPAAGVVTADVDGVISANISGSTLSKTGAGKLTLSGDANGFSAISLDAGTLQVGAGGASGTIAATITNNAALIFDRSGTLTNVGVISGTGSLTKTGSGLVTLAANSSGFSGPVTVNGGELRLGAIRAQGTGAITVNAGGQLNLNGVTQTGLTNSYTIAGTGPDGNGALVSTNAGINQNSTVGFLTLAADSTVGALGPGTSSAGRFDIAYNNGWVQGNNFTLTKVGNSQVAIRGPTTNLQIVANGGIIYGEDNDLSLGTNAVVNAGGKLGGYGARTFALPVTLNGGQLVSLGGPSGQTWTGPINVATDSVISTAAGAGYTEQTIAIPSLISGPGKVTKEGTSSLFLTGSLANAGSGELRLTRGILNLSKPAGVDAWVGPITITNIGGDAILRHSASDQIPDSTVLRFGRNPASGYPHWEMLGNSETLAGIEAAVDGVIQNAAFTNGIYAESVLTISNTADYSYNGYLRNISGTTVTGSLRFVKTGPGRQVLASANIIYTGATTIAQGTLVLSNTTAFASPILNNAQLIFDLPNALNYGTRLLSGTGSLVKIGASTLRLDGTNTMSGPYYLHAGYIDAYGNGCISSGAYLEVNSTLGLVLYNGTTQWVGTLVGTNTAARIFNNTANRTGEVVVVGASSNTYLGFINVGSGAVRLRMAGAGTQVLGGTVDNSAGRIAVDAGTLVLAKASSPSVHAAALTVEMNGGTLKMGGTGDDQIYDQTDVISIGGTIDLNGRNEGWDELNGTGGTVLNDAAATTSRLTLGMNNGSFTSGVAIADGAGVVAVSKQGTGLWVVSNAYTFSGGSYISNGTLRVANASGQALGAGTTVVESLGIIDGMGTLGPMLIRNNGNVTPGIGSLATLNAGNTTLGGAGRLTIDIMDFAGTAGATNGWDLLNIGGTLTASSSGASPFVIALRSVLPSGAAGAAANFVDTQSYTVKVATASGGISAISPASVIVDATSLLNPQSGFWKVQVNGNDLELVYGFGVVDTDPVSAWTNSLALSFCGYDRAEPLTNFPALIVLSKYDARGSNMYSVLSDVAAGSDLRFATTDAVPALLNYEIEKWNPDGDSYVWVQIPLLTPGLQIEIRGGNPNATSAPPAYAINGSVWSNNGYLGVWHFNGGVAVDSAGTNDGVRFGTGALAGNSIMGDAANFNGTSQFIDMPDQVFDFSAGLTVEAWARPSTAANYARIIDFGSGQGQSNIIMARNGTSANMQFETYQTQAGQESLISANTPIPAVGSWGYWVASESAGASNNATMRLFMNGSERAVSTNYSTPPVVLRTSNFVGKSNWGTDALFNGLIDELRLSTVERSSNWVYASYINIASPQAFVCISGESKIRYWDANLVSSGRQDGSGTWNLSSNAWQDAFASNVAWASGVNAVLGSGTPSAGTNVITLADNVLVSGVSVTAGPSYRIDGPAVHLFTLSGATYNIQTNLEIRSMLTGYGFTKTGGGILWLNPTNGIANNYTGTIAVTEGELWVGGTVGDGTVRGGDVTAASGTVIRLTAANPFVNNSMITLAEGALLNLNGFSDAVGAISGGGTITNNNQNFHVDDQARNAIFTGDMNLGTGSFFVRGLNGAGTQTLTGTNRFGGIGIERAGANLILSGGSNYLSGGIFIGQQADGGTLALNDTVVNVAGSVQLGENATFRHGELYQTNSTMTVGGQVRIGHWGSETSIWVMTSGSITMTSEPIVNNPFGASGTETNGAFYIGVDGNGIFRQYGGVLKAPAIVVDNRTDNPVPDILQTEGGIINLGRWGISGNASLVMFGGSELQAYQSWTSTLPAQLTGTNGSLTVSPSTNVIAFNGALTGIGGLNINGTTGSGAVLLGATSGYTGPTIVSNGYLFVNAAATATPITVETAGGLGGSGAIGTATVAGVLSPGFLTGRLNARDVTMLENSRVIVHVNNFAGTAGGANNGWDLLTVTNTLTLGGVATNPLVFDLTSLAGTAPGAAVNFNALQSYTIQVANVSGSLVGFDATTVALVTTNFLNASVGTWSIRTNLQTIEIVYTATFAPTPGGVAYWDATNDVASFQDGNGTWDNTNTNWSDGAVNIAWNGGTAYFGLGGGVGALSVDVASPGVLGEVLYFSAGPNYTLNGPGSIGLLNQSEITADSDVTITANLSGSNLVKKGAARLTLLGYANGIPAPRIEAGTLQIGNGGTVGSISSTANITNSGRLVINRSDALTHTGVISGSGEVEQAGPGVLTLSQVNTYLGNTYITGGTLMLGNQRALGDTAAGTFISPGASLDFNNTAAGTNNGGEVVTASGFGVNNAGALVRSTAGNPNDMLRYLVITGATAIGGTGGWIALDGTGTANTGYIAGDTNTLDKVGPNVVVIRDGIAITVGVINVRGGQLSMETTATWNNEYPLNIHTGALFYSYNWTQTMGREVNLYGGTLNSLAGTLNMTSTLNVVSNGSIILNSATLNHTGVIAGAGSLLLNASGAGQIMTWTGPDANTANGELVLFMGTMRFAKPAGVNAWGGNSIVISNSTAASTWMELRSSEQFPDSAALRFYKGGGNWPYFKMLGNSETVAGIETPAAVAGAPVGVIENVEGEGSPGSDSTLTLNSAVDYTYTGYLRDRASGSSTNRIHLRKLGTGRQSLVGGRIGDIIWAGNVSVENGTLTFSNCTVGTSFQPVITNSSVVEFTGLAAGNVGLRRPLLAGGGSYLMSGQNQFLGVSEATGTVEIVSGRLYNDSSGGIWTNSQADVVVHSGAVWDMRATMLQADVLTGTGTVLNSYYATPGAFTNCLVLGVANGSGAFHGSIVGDVTVLNASNGLINLIKVGSGTQTFAGVNAYGGFTAISNGTLLVDGSLGTGVVTVAAAGTLGGSGIVSGNVTVAGTLAPGSSPGRLTLAAGLTLASTATLAIEVNGTAQAVDHDHLVVNSAVVLDGSLSVSISTSYTPAAGSVYTVMTANALSGSFLNATNGAQLVVGVNTVTVHYGIGSLYNANEVVLTSVVSVNPDSDGDGILDQWELDNFGTLTNATATSQSDADGVSDFDEFIAGTDPKLATSYLRLTNEVRSLSGQILYWPSATGRLYDVELSTNLMPSGVWSLVGTNLPSTAPQNIYTSPAPDNVQHFRIRVRIAP